MSARAAALGLALTAQILAGCGGESSASGWVRDVVPTADGVSFALVTDATPPQELQLNIVGQLEGGGENFDANHLLDHALKGQPVALSYAVDAGGRLVVVRATDANWLAARTPPPAP